MSDRFTNEITQLTRLKVVLDRDSVLPLRFDIQRLTLDHRRFKLTIRGISSLIRNPSLSPATANSFTLIVNVPSGYPWHQIIHGIKYQIFGFKNHSPSTHIFGQTDEYAGEQAILLSLT
jgi:hypothetical protein